MANGDCLVDFDLNKLMRFHNKYKPIVSVPILKVNTSGNYGIVEMNDNFVKNLKEKILSQENLSLVVRIFFNQKYLITMSPLKIY